MIKRAPITGDGGIMKIIISIRVTPTSVMSRVHGHFFEKRITKMPMNATTRDKNQKKSSKPLIFTSAGNASARSLILNNILCSIRKEGMSMKGWRGISEGGLASEIG